MKKKMKFQYWLLIITILLVLVIGSCKKDDQKIIKEKISGQVQKGPYINGTSITMSELSSSLTQIGNNFTTQITNNIGSFELDNIILTSGFVEFSASGYYFDEVKGNISVAPLNLFALSDIKDLSTVNVNILTHLEKQRVNYLRKQNKNFSEAKKIAQGEILAIFGLNHGSINNSETLDISVNYESNAILLAISIILQGNRSVGDLTELLANISNDIKEDGNLNDGTILTSLRTSAKELDLTSIRSNLVKRFQDIGVSATIPGFEKYINEFLTFTGEKPTVTIEPTTEITTASARFIAIVNPDYISTTISFEYGETPNYGNSIPAAQNPVTGGSSVNISADATGLLPGKIYHLRVKAENTTGVTYSSDATFTTLGKVPEAVTSGANNIFLYSATLEGSVNANHLATVVDFEWGTTTEYGNTVTSGQSPVTGHIAVSVNAELSGLEEETTYHYRLKAENSLGIAYGDDKILTTAGKSPVPVTMPATNVQKNTASLNGSVNANSFSTTVAFEWGTTAAYGNTITAVESPFAGNAYATVSAELTGLEMGTEYHFRIIAVNEFGTRTSDDMTFTTLLPVTDFDGNIYDVRNYGTQVWMLENLKTTKYNNGDLIGTTATPTLNYFGESAPKYQWAYDGDESYVAIYGRLYTWYAATDNRKICPTGWHLPTDEEWTIFTDFLTENGFGFEGNGNDIAKSIASSGWGLDPTPGVVGNDQVSNNSSGFTAVPAGSRTTDGFYSLNYNCFWWTATEITELPVPDCAWFRFLHTYTSVLIKDYSGLNKNYGYSVRCLKD